MGVPFAEPSNVGTPKLRLKTDSLQQKRQTSVDPTSLGESVSKEASHPSFLLPHLNPGKFLSSSSLPNSAMSSPRISSPLKKKWKNQSSTQPSSPLKMIDPTTGQQSLALSRLAQLQEIHFRKSKSCGEGRNTSPSVDIEMCKRELKAKHLIREISSFDKKIDCDDNHAESNNYNFHDQDSTREARRRGNQEVTYHEKFKCGACLYLPGFGKAKPVRSRRIHEEETINGDDVTKITMRRQLSHEKQAMTHLISNRVSLEKFECGSWTSSAIVMDGEDDDIVDAGGLFFDLPIEDNRDNESTAFAFDGDLKGVLKKVVVRPGTSGSNGVNNGKSVESGSRHVRFSDVSPRSNSASPKILCISPQLRKARDDFNAFLEAQTA